MNSDTKSLPAGTILYSDDTKYSIVEVLGSGGFGITYLALGAIKVKNVTTEAKFAIKELYPSEFCDREGTAVVPKSGKAEDFERSKKDFISEARKLHTLGTGNDNIVKVNEVFESNGTAYYVMQYIKGSSLTSYIKKNGPLSYSRAVEILSPILDAVEYLHKSRINHLDIKPDNIMLHQSMDGSLVTVLIDFGLSVHFKKNGDKTSPKGVQGVSPGYSPLEQYAGIREFSPQSDIYSLAATLLFLLTGKTPQSASEIKIADIKDQLKKVVPESAIEGIAKAFNKSSDDRTSSVSAFKADLGLSSDGGSVTEVIAGDSDGGSMKKYMRPVLLSLGGLVVAAGLILGISKCGGSSSNSDEPLPPPAVDSVVEANDTIGGSEISTSSQSENESETKEEDKEVKKQPEEKKESAKTEKDKNDTEVAKVKPVADKKEESGSSVATQQTAPAEKKPAKTAGSLSLGYGTYRGEMVDGKPSGKGRITYTSSHAAAVGTSVMAEPGDYLEGTFSNGRLEFGKLYDSSGTLKKTIIP